jgi:hypothetical protein
MCDYSLAGIRNRLAVEGEQLVVQRFSTGAQGLASPTTRRAWLWFAKECAVCVPPGARLLLRDIPQGLQRQFGLGAIEEVTFVQLSTTAYQYRDAVRFKNGREALLQKLPCGQQVDVLCLSSDDDPEEKEHQKLEEEYHRIFGLR